MAQQTVNSGPLLKPEEEAVLLGAWLSEINTEHIRQFETSDFLHEKLFNALYRGRNAADIAAADIGYTMTDLANLIMQYTASFYTQLYKKAVFEKTQRNALRGIIHAKTLNEMYDNLGSVIRSGDVPQASKGILEEIKREREYRRAEKSVRYGLPRLDRLTGGLHRRELTVVAARPGVGKSAFGLQMAAKTLQRNEKCLYFTLEMSTSQQMERLLIQTGKDTQENTRSFGELSADAEKFVNTVENEGKLKFYDETFSLEDISTTVQKERPYLVVIDQLTQVQSSKYFKNRLEELQEITKKLKRLALVEDVAVLLLCQINRDAANNEPTLANLKGSGQIEEDADNVILLHDLSKKNDDSFLTSPTERETLLKLDKHRGGQTARYRIMFLANRLLFREMEDV